MILLQRHICGGARIRPPDSEFCEDDVEALEVVDVVVALVAEVAVDVVLIDGVVETLSLVLRVVAAVVVELVVVAVSLDDAFVVFTEDAV